MNETDLQSWSVLVTEKVKTKCNNETDTIPSLWILF